MGENEIYSDKTERTGRRLLKAFDSSEASQDYYATHFSLPFIRDAVALYHENAKGMLSGDNPAAFEEKKAQALQQETARAEVFLNEPHRSDYVTTLNELFDLGSKKFQRS